MSEAESNAETPAELPDKRQIRVTRSGRFAGEPIWVSALAELADEGAALERLGDLAQTGWVVSVFRPCSMPTLLDDVAAKLPLGRQERKTLSTLRGVLLIEQADGVSYAESFHSDTILRRALARLRAEAEAPAVAVCEECRELDAHRPGCAARETLLVSARSL